MVCEFSGGRVDDIVLVKLEMMGIAFCCHLQRGVIDITHATKKGSSKFELKVYLVFLEFGGTLGLRTYARKKPRLIHSLNLCKIHSMMSDVGPRQHFSSRVSSFVLNTDFY
jgi:hypothetical protein